MNGTKAWIWSLAIILVGQLCLGVWKAAVMSTDIATLQNELQRRTADRYYRQSARQDFELRDERIRDIQTEISRLDARFDNYPPAWLLDDVQELKQRLKELERK